MLWVALHFRFPEPPAPGTLERLAAWACQFTPKVSLEPPQALVAEVQASLRYFGGLEDFLRRLRAGLADLGREAALAVAATPRAALWRAIGGEGNLEDLPLSVLGPDTDFLKSLGLSTLGEVLRLPREGLAKRCGQTLVDGLDRALGALPEPREFFSPPARFDASLELPGGVAHAEGVLFAAKRLFTELEGLLRARQEGIRGATLGLFDFKGKEAIVEIRLASPARQAERMMKVLRERIATVSLREPVESIRLQAADFSPLAERSGAMFGDAWSDGEDWARLAERLQARLGEDALYGLTTQPDHRPEFAWRRVEPGEWDPREFRQPGPRPLWLMDSPRKITDQDLHLLAGPERIECGWWDGDEAKRDYFVARAGASLVWIYREADAWYLHGFFA